MQDTWQSGNPYEYYMGRWSKLVASQFIDWLSPNPRMDWLDIGCGTGALSEAIVNKSNAKKIIALDQSEGFLQTTAQRLNGKVQCQLGNALELPLADKSVNMTVSGLLFNFLPDSNKALSEMRRVTTPGGTVALYVWDYAGRMDFLNYFWDVAVELDPQANNLHEARRFPNSTSAQLQTLFAEMKFSGISVAPLDITTRFSNFDDYWLPFLGKQGPAPTYLAGLSDVKQNQIAQMLKQRIPISKDGSIQMAARAWAIKGTV